MSTEPKWEDLTDLGCKCIIARSLYEIARAMQKAAYPPMLIPDSSELRKIPGKLGDAEL